MSHSPQPGASKLRTRRELRVLHLRNSTRIAGPERLLLDQAALAAPGISHTFASFRLPGRRNHFLDAAQTAGVSVRPLLQRGSYDPRLLPSVGRLVAETDPHVVVSHDYKADLLTILAARGRRRIAVLHGYTLQDRKVGLFERIDRALLRGFHGIVTVSPQLRDSVSAGGALPGQVHVIENGVRAGLVSAAAREGRLPVRRELGIPEGTMAVISLGRLSPEKGQAVLLEALARLAVEPPVRLLLVGDGPARSVLERRASAPELAGRVHFLGWRQDPWRCLGAGDLFALPSRTEGLPLALLEAMASGLPPVASRVGAVPALLEDDHGILVTPGDPAELAEALRSLIEDASRRARMGAAAQTRVEESYRAGTQVRRFEALYRKVAGD